MSSDHLFVDSLGHRVHGAKSMLAGWKAYFAMCPDYAITIDALLERSGMVLAVGVASGTIDGVAWQTPAAWQARVTGGRIAEWRVFADNKPVYEILAKRKP
jgi:hypothetical protein